MLRYWQSSPYNPVISLGNKVIAVSLLHKEVENECDDMMMNSLVRCGEQH